MKKRRVEHDVYICDVCKTAHYSKIAALECEQNHGCLTVTAVPKLSYKGSNIYPSHLTVLMSNGSLAYYKRIKK